MSSSTRKEARLYPVYRESGIPWMGAIPDHWGIRRLKAVAKIRTGGKDTIHKKEDGKYPFFIRSQTAERIDTWSYDGEGILTAGDGAVGEIFHYVKGKFDFHQRVYLFSDFFDVLGKFFFHYLKSNLRHETSQGTAKSTVESLRLPMLQNFPVPLPPRDEQAAIVRYLDDADQRIRAYVSAKERLIVLLEEERQAVIHQAVTRGLDPNVKLKPSGVEWLGDVPEHWEIQQLKQKSRIFRGRFSHRPRNDASLYDGPYPFIQTGDIARAGKWITTYEQTLNDRGLAVSQMFPKGTLVMTIAANIGDAAILDLDACFPDSVVGFTPIHNVDRDYLYNLFQSMKTEFLRVAPVNTQGNLNVDRIGATIVAFPPLAEQTAIAAHLNQLAYGSDTAIDRARRQIELMEEYRTRLIADVVTGKIDVREAKP